MQQLEWHNRDKSEWPRGEWDNEPDKAQWTDPATGMPCLLVRNHLGALCGYVGVEETHPLFGKPYDEVSEHDLQSHGELTFSDRCHPGGDEAHGICHIPGEGEPDHVWWFGFDCGHCDDYMPGMPELIKSFGMEDYQTYRNVDYVKHACAELASGLKAVADGTIAPSEES